MSLEKEIKQTTFKNEHNRAIVNLIYTYNHVTTELQKILHSHNLTLQQYNILKILRGRHPESATNGMIRERMLDKNSDVTRIVDRLIKDDLVKRQNCSNDRRCVNVYINQKGLDLLKRLDEYSDQMDAILNRLTTAEAAALNKLLDKIRQ
ncbi:MAG: MarR family transcriptional regulator [Balneolales bacterium]